MIVIHYVKYNVCDTYTGLARSYRNVIHCLKYMVCDTYTGLARSYCVFRIPNAGSPMCTILCTTDTLVINTSAPYHVNRGIRMRILGIDYLHYSRMGQATVWLIAANCNE